MDLKPLFVYRDYHSLFRASDYFDFYTKQHLNGLEIYPHFDSDAIYFGFSKGDFEENRAWYYNLEYQREQYRGLDYHEDAKRLGSLKLSLDPKEKDYLVFTTEAEMLEQNPELLEKVEVKRIKDIRKSEKDEFYQDLLASADQFIVSRTDSKSIIAGYHWFTDWGRDTMIAMRGLTIATGKQEESKSIIKTFLKYLDRGMIPNRFPDQGEEPEYNTIDATLWVFVVAYEYLQAFKDEAFIKEIFPFLTEIILQHMQGTRYNIHVREDGLIYGGEEGAQLTWMDAKVGDYVVTPRIGCPVEINALWYNALMIYAEFSEMLGEDAKEIKAQAKNLQNSFRDHFINEHGYLNDVIIPDEIVDSSLRPNQVYAVSLPFSPLTQTQGKSVVKWIENELYTDLGLRSLNEDHTEFKPVYGGDMWARDTSYHQGTVWGFLWGEYALAYLKVNKFSAKSVKTIHEKLEGLKKHFYESDCLHGISEIFDGKDPLDGRGCVNQAWSIGMVLKVLAETEKETKKG